VIAIIWGPYQETAIHDHFNWCVVGVLDGRAHVTNYDRIDDEAAPGKAELRIRDSYVANPGSVAALLPPPRSNIHRMANAGRPPAVTIHTYGDPGTRATTFDIRAGTYEPVDLKFHNLEA
jgi:predicted metal-dependent enzyme (double-stranded beta helix superfamily)